jgi:hypothetical protein
LTGVNLVLDASALLAILQSEPGNARVVEILDRCVMHTVNVAEVSGKLVRSGMPLDRAEALLAELHVRTEPRLEEAGKCGGLWAPDAISDCRSATVSVSPRLPVPGRSPLPRTAVGRSWTGSTSVGLRFAWRFSADYRAGVWVPSTF